MSPWESESWEVISHNAIVVTSGCINKATKYTSHVEKEGEAWSQGIARTRDVKSPGWYGEVAPRYTIWFFFSRRHMNSIQTMVVRMGPWIRHPWNFIPHGYAEGPSSWRARIIGTCVFSSIYNVKFPSGPCSMIRSLENLQFHIYGSHNDRKTRGATKGWNRRCLIFKC